MPVYFYNKKDKPILHTNLGVNMKRIVILLVIAFTSATIGQTAQSNIPPKIFDTSHSKILFNTNVQIIESDSSTHYYYTSVYVNNKNEDTLLNSLLTAYDGDVEFPIYRARSEQRVNYSLYGVIDTTKALECGYASDLSKSAMMDSLGLLYLRR